MERASDPPRSRTLPSTPLPVLLDHPRGRPRVQTAGSHLRALHSRDEIFDEDLDRQAEIEKLVRTTLEQRLTGSESLLDAQHMAREVVNEEVGA